MKTHIGLAALVAGLSSAALAQNFNDPAEFERQKALLTVSPQGPEGKPWEQHLGGETVDTARYRKPGPYRLCFSNAGVNNPWRVVGFTNMQAEVDANKADIASFTHADAEGKDDKQISDINAFVNSGQCDALIVSPNTTAALTPAVEAAAKKLPVVVFDRGVDTKAPVTFVNPIGGYGFGIQGASFIAEKIPAGGSVLALRILPGVDVLENRWAAAERIFKEKGIKIVGTEFTDGDNAKTKAIVEDYLNRFGKIDGVWMDAGATAVAALEAFEDAGKPYPVINGEDQQDFLQKWKKNKLTAIAPTYPTYQWRTPVIAAIRILKGEPVIGPTWKLPQPAITAATLDRYVNDKMPPLHYALCGCEQMANYPARWGGK
ncbi:ABC transporter substrate-binding protein [Bosea sp. CS1GBMeth4]|uniref:ABC transporter substrate-binding protein n=1 Tax=Bosea sp. CS1GBMeth4 TaxID=1892849 RepID=UPI0016441A8F|nr:ABC transporter substrate-binding protein [Bosea sp. CS1GBMeth4]